MRAGGVPARCGVRAALAASHILVLSPALGGKRLSQVWQATRVKALLRVSRLLWEVAGAWNGSRVHYGQGWRKGTLCSAPLMNVYVAKFGDYSRRAIVPILGI